MPENSLWKLIKQSLISHLIMILFGALVAGGGSYLAIRDRINDHDYKLSEHDRQIRDISAAVRLHHEAASGEQAKLAIFCERLGSVENKIDRLLMRSGGK